MKLPNWFKISWWVILLIVITYYLVNRFDSFMVGESSAYDIVVFLFWICLCMLPLIQEIEIFGFKIKKEIEEIKSHVNTQIESIRTEIRNTVDVKNQLSQNINIPLPAPDRELLKIEERIKSAIDKELKKREGEELVQEINKPNIDQSTVELFEIRYMLEAELGRIWEERYGKKKAKFIPINKIVRTLSESELIDKDAAVVIREIYSIASSAIHGAEVNNIQHKFVLDTFSWVSKLLREL